MATEKQLFNGGASSVLYTDRRNFYIDPQTVHQLWTDVAPFTTMISSMGSRSTNDPVFKMFEHRNPWVKQEFTIGTDVASLGAGDTESAAITPSGIVGLPAVDDSWIGLVCEVWNADKTTSKGNILITSRSSATVDFKNLNDAAIDVTNTDIAIVVGNAHGEGTEAPEAWADELQVVWNSTQIFKTPLQITGTLLQAALRGESSELERLRLQKNQEHKIQKEKAFLFGTRVGGTNLGDNMKGTSDDTFGDTGRTTPAGNLVRTTYGIVSAIEDFGSSTATDDYQNIFTVDSSYAYGNFVDDMEKVFQYVPTSGVKRAFVGAGALGYWSKMSAASNMAGNSGWTVNLGDMKRDALGFNYRVLETPHGMLQLIPTPALRGPYNKYMLIVDDSNLFHAQYRAPMYQTNIKTDNAFDAVKDQYFSDEGIGISLIDSHSLFKITA
jgi:hypothetical protein